MKVDRCDRCPRVGVELVQVLSFELCQACRSDLCTWVLATSGVPSISAPARLKVGTPWRIVQELLEKHGGTLTPEQYGAVTGKAGREPYYALRYFVRKGLLETDRTLDGSIVFFATRPWTQQEAAQ